MEKLLKFVTDHLAEDTSRLILDRKKYPEIDMDLAVSCIESRRKLKGKVQEWYDEDRLVFPLKLSAEQCSSSATGRYKAELAERIVKDRGHDGRWTIADLTGGLGVDSWFFSKRASKVIYCEMQEVLCKAAEHNYMILNAENISVNNIQITQETCSELKRHDPDIIYLDPARRGEGGKKVFLIEDCTPDVLNLKEELFGICRHILIKLSPMADITMVCERLGRTCREVHVVATGGECKELLIWMDREHQEEPVIHAVELHQDTTSSVFTFTQTEEKGMQIPPHCQESAVYIFEPGKALMKAGPFNLIASRFGIYKLGKSTHYYITDSIEKAEELRKFGKIFRIMECMQLDKRNIKEIGKRYPKAEVSARNIPMDTDTLRKKLGVTSGDDAHIFGLKSDSEGNILIVTNRI